MSTIIDSLLAQAKTAIECGEGAMRDAAEFIARAEEQGATQREIAQRVGKSAAWVNALLAWRRDGFKGEAFARSKRPAFSRAEQQKTNNPSDRKLLVKALGMLGSNGDGEVLNAARHAERLRKKLNMSWDELIIAAAEKSQARAA